MSELLADWRMPEPPAAGAVAVYYIDCDELSLHWVDPKTGDHYEDEGSDIPWPFESDDAHISEIRGLGFVDCENYPEE